MPLIPQVKGQDGYKKKPTRAWVEGAFIQEYGNIRPGNQNKIAIALNILPGESLSAHDCLAAVDYVLIFVLMTRLGRQGWYNREVPGAAPGWEGGNYSGSSPGL